MGVSSRAVVLGSLVALVGECAAALPSYAKYQGVNTNTCNTPGSCARPLLPLHPPSLPCSAGADANSACPPHASPSLAQASLIIRTSALHPLPLHPSTALLRVTQSPMPRVSAVPLPRMIWPGRLAATHITREGLRHSESIYTPPVHQKATPISSASTSTPPQPTPSMWPRAFLISRHRHRRICRRRRCHRSLRRR